MDTFGTTWSKTTKYLVAIGLIIFAIYVLRLSQEVIPLLIIAALIAVMARPLITWLNVRARMTRGLAVAVVYLGVLILFPLALLLAIPAVVNAVNYVINLDYQAFLRGLLEWLRSTLATVRAMQLPLGTLDSYVDQIVTELLDSLQSTNSTAAPTAPSVGTILRSLGTAVTTTFSTVTSLVGAVFSNLVLFIFVFLSSIYMSLSAHTYRESFLRAVPPAYVPEVTLLLNRIGRMWAAFFRGQLTLMLVIGLMSWIGLAIMGVPGALYLGITAGLLELIPNLGPIIATIPAVIVALLQGSNFLPVSHLTMALIVIAFYVLVQQLENNLIVPRVLGGAVDLPPLVVMTGVLVGATAGGLLGALLATPVIATAREILRYIYGKMLDQDPFPSEDAPLEPQPRSLIKMRQMFGMWTSRFARSRPPVQNDPAAPGVNQPPSVDTSVKKLPDE